MLMSIYIFIGRVEDIRHSQLSSTSLQRECTTILQDLQQLSCILHEFVQLYGENALQIEDSLNGPDRLLQCPVTQNGLRGRPAYIISKVQLETLIELGFNYTTIARMFGVSERTLLRRRIEYELPVGAVFSELSDNDLDIAVRAILQVSILVSSYICLSVCVCACDCMCTSGRSPEAKRSRCKLCFSLRS